ncbi:MAG: ABC transporter substrate-binding protein [Bacteroidales bacterium]|nr:ABC transporter substrate-binding protein [Bacteroidales bacterium]MCF8396550.1 ABC transporter substrate-binding protein [Bacteroidales bacterium]
MRIRNFLAKANPAILLMLILMGAFVPGAAYHTNAQELTSVRYMPHWLHQAQFAGYYMAKERGIYEQYGLDVTILMGGPNFPAVPTLTEDRAEFTSMFLSGAIKARARGVKVVNIAQMSQRSALIYIAKKSSGITSPEDFNNKRIGVWRSDFQELPRAFLNKYDIEAEIVPITSTVNLFLKDGVDVMCVMWYNEYHQVLNFGINEDELNVFEFHDHDLDFPEDGIICLEKFYNENTDVCRNFVEASIDGWNYAFEHKEEALDLVISYMEAANIPANRAHQKWMLNRMEDIFKADNGVINVQLKKADYDQTARILLNSAAIEHIPDYDEFNKTSPEK